MAEEPIVRITDQEHLRAKILEARNGGDPRWQQKWDDLDAFPYNDTVQHQQEWLVDHPVFAGFLQSLAKPAPPAPRAAAPLPPAQKYMDKVAVPPRQPVDPRAGAAQSELNQWMPPKTAKLFGGGPPVPQPPMGPDMGAPVRSAPPPPPPQAPPARGMGVEMPGSANRYTPPPPMTQPNFGPQLQEYGLAQWLPPELAKRLRR